MSFSALSAAANFPMILFNDLIWWPGFIGYLRWICRMGDDSCTK